jgi:hypothetical protein
MVFTWLFTSSLSLALIEVKEYRKKDECEDNFE